MICSVLSRRTYLGKANSHTPPRPQSHRKVHGPRVHGHSHATQGIKAQHAHGAGGIQPCAKPWPSHHLQSSPPVCVRPKSWRAKALSRLRHTSDMSRSRQSDWRVGAAGMILCRARGLCVGRTIGSYVAVLSVEVRRPPSHVTSRGKARKQADARLERSLTQQPTQRGHTPPRRVLSRADKPPRCPCHGRIR